MNPEETFQCAVGKLIFVFGDFEELLTCYLCKLINHDECVGRAVTDDLMVTGKIKLLRKLAPYFHHQPDHELFAILKDFEGLKNKRNGFIHGTWHNALIEQGILLCSQRKFIVEKKQVKKGRTSFRLSQGDLIKIEDIEALTNEIESLKDRLSIVNDNLHVLDIHDTTK